MPSTGDLVAQFRALYDAKRLGHAYIVSGAGSAVATAAIASSLLCADPLSDGRACGICEGCARVAGGNHPGLAWIEPDGASLKVAQMRAAQRSDSRLPSGVPLHVTVLAGADKLTAEAANAILKWLEEPHPHRLFLLAADAPDHLLATVRSRCQTVRVDGAEAVGSDGEEQAFALWREAVLELTEATAGRMGAGWRASWERLTGLGLSSQDWLRVTDLWIVCLRDVMAVACGGQPTAFADARDRLCSLAAAVEPARVGRLAARAVELRVRLLSHVNPGLALEAMLLSVEG